MAVLEAPTSDEVVSYRLLPNEAVDNARGRIRGLVGVLEVAPEEIFRLREGDGESPWVGGCEEGGVTFWPDDSAGRTLSLSQRILRAVVFEAEDILRGRLRPMVISRSSENFPFDVNCECSDGWPRATASVSRIGNGDRLQTWMVVT